MRFVTQRALFDVFLGTAKHEILMNPMRFRCPLGCRWFNVAHKLAAEEMASAAVTTNQYKAAHHASGLLLVATPGHSL